VKDVVFERLSDEALHDPQTGVPPPLPRIHTDRPDAPAATVAHSDSQPNVVEPYSAGQTQTQITRTSAKTVNIMRFPESLPAPNHQFNRGFVDAGFQRTRALSPQEVLTVRGEVKDATQRFWKQFPSYYRLVSDPVCRGKMIGDFCCPDGQLVRGRVYRRFYGDHNTTPAHYSMRWQHVGGWRLLRRLRKGSLFPSDVPLYSVAPFPQIDYPNTLIGKKLTPLEKTAMALNSPMDIMSVPDSELGVEDLKAKRVMQRDLEQEAKAQEELNNIFGANAGENQQPVVDGRKPISAEQWHDAVRKAKQRVVRHSQKAVPNAAKTRNATRRLRVQSRKQTMANRRRDY
ncbi:Hypothetical protein, putative, partial [Bodo saltans]